MIRNTTSQDRLGESIKSLQVVSEYAADVDLPEVGPLVERLLFVLTGGRRGHPDAPEGPVSDGSGHAPDARRIALDDLRRRLRAIADDAG